MEVKISFRKSVEFDFEGEMIMSAIYWAQKCELTSIIVVGSLASMHFVRIFLAKFKFFKILPNICLHSRNPKADCRRNGGASVK